MRYILLSLILILVGANPSAARAQGSACLAADETTQGIIKKLSRLMDADAGSVALDRALYGLPRVDPSTITVVTDKTICAKAERAYTAALKSTTSTPSGKVYVIKVGTVYVVQDPQRKGGEYVIEIVMDSQFRVIARSLA
jgi:hypothetical protein